jgi:hypothetical protein
MKWRAWYEAQPRGEERADLHAALIAKEILNVAIALAGGEPATTAELLEHLEDHWREPTAAEKRHRKLRRRQRGLAKLRGVGKAFREAQREQQEQQDKKRDKKRGAKHRQAGSPGGP